MILDIRTPGETQQYEDTVDSITQQYDDTGYTYPRRDSQQYEDTVDSITQEYDDTGYTYPGETLSSMKTL